MDQVLPDGPVELAAHLPKAAGGAHQRRLRSGEALAGGQIEAEVIGVDAQDQPVVLQLGALRRGQEVAAVYQRRPVAQALILVGVVVAEDHEGVVVVAGGPSDALHALDPGAQRGAVHHAFQRVTAVEGDEVEVSPLYIQTQGGAPVQPDGGRPLVDHPDGPGDEVIPLQHTVIQLHRHAGGGVLHQDHQGLPLVPAPEGGQPLQGIFARPELVAGIAQVGQAAAVLRLEFDGGQAEVPHAAGGILLGQSVQGVVPAVARLVGVGGGAPIGILDQIGQVAAADPRAIVGVQEHIILVGFHLVGGVLGVEGEDFVFLVDDDHRDTP